MMKTKTLRTVAISTVLCIAMSGCGGLRAKVKQDPTKPPSPVLDNIAVQLDQAKDGAKALRKTKEILLAEGKISKGVSHKMTEALIKIDTGIGITAKKVRTYDAFTPSARDDLFKLVQDIEAGYREFRAAGIVGGNDAIDKALLVFDSALAALRTLLRPTQAELLDFTRPLKPFALGGAL